MCTVLGNDFSSIFYFHGNEYQSCLQWCAYSFAVCMKSAAEFIHSGAIFPNFPWSVFHFGSIRPSGMGRCCRIFQTSRQNDIAFVSVAPMVIQSMTSRLAGPRPREKKKGWHCYSKAMARCRGVQFVGTGILAPTAERQQQ